MEPDVVTVEPPLRDPWEYPERSCHATRTPPRSSEAASGFFVSMGQPCETGQRYEGSHLASSHSGG
jgi:hypothetical protein